MGTWKHDLDENENIRRESNKYINKTVLTKNSRRRIIYFTTISFIVIAGITYYSLDKNFDSSKFIYTSTGILAAIAFTIAMLSYLENNTNNNYLNNNYGGTNRKTDLSTLEEKIDFLAVNLKKTSSSDFKIDEDKIYRIVEEGLKANIQESFVKSLVEKYSETIINEIHYKDISDEIARSKNRILNEIGSLNKRGNLNLVIGSLTTILSVGVLLSSFLFSVAAVKIDEVFIHFLPRVSIVLFAEIFAFFFLRLYRNSLIDIKYYQNELTNIESKGLALKAAILMKDKDLYNNIIMDFSKIERNGIIKNDESTSTIILNKNESEKDKSYSDNVKSLVEVLIDRLVTGKK